MSECCLIKKVATVEVYENKNEVRAYGFMTGDRNTPVMEVKFRHLWGEENLSKCKLRWIIVDDVGSLLVGEVPISEDNKALIELPNQLFTGERRMKVQLTVASCDGARILNLQQFTDLKVINNLATNEVVEPVYQILINTLYDEVQKGLDTLDDSYAKSKASLEQYLITAENGGNAEFLQGYNPKNFNRVENTVNELINSAGSKYKVGDIVDLQGYYEAGDGAHHKRKIESADDRSGVQLTNGLWANIVHNGEVNVSWFGAKGDGINDDTVAIQKALNYDWSNNICVTGGSKVYGISEQLTFLRIKELKLKVIKNIAGEVLVNRHWQYTHSVKRLHLDCNNLADVGMYLKNLARANFDDVIIENSVVDNLKIGTNFYFNTLSNFTLLRADNNFNIECEISSESAPYYVCNNNTFSGFSLQYFRKKALKVKGASNNVFERFNVEANNVTSKQFSLIEITRSQLNHFNVFWVEPYLADGTYTDYLLSINDFFSRDISRGNKYENWLVAGTQSSAEAHPNFAYIGKVRDDIFDNIELNRINNGFTYGSLAKGVKTDNVIFKQYTGVKFLYAGDNCRDSKNKQIHKNITWSGPSKFVISNGDLTAGYEYIVSCAVSKFSGVSDYNQFRPFFSIVGNNVQIFTNPDNNNNVYFDIEVKEVYTGNYATSFEVNSLDDEFVVSLLESDAKYSMNNVGVSNDFFEYRQSLHAYAQEQKLIEQQRQEAYEQALEENPELTYEDWLSAQPQSMPFAEPQPSQALLDFKEKYLG